MTIPFIQEFFHQNVFGQAFISVLVGFRIQLGFLFVVFCRNGCLFGNLFLLNGFVVVIREVMICNQEGFGERFQRSNWQPY